MYAGAPCEMKNADDSTLPVHAAGAGSTYDLVDVMSKIEGQGKCDKHVFKAKAEAQTCGSNGPLPYKYPFLDTRRCDMMFDCPYEDIGAGSSLVDEGAQCMEHCMCITTVFASTKHIFRLLCTV